MILVHLHYARLTYDLQCEGEGEMVGWELFFFLWLPAARR